MATVAIIWQSCGPYHLARLAGARAVAAQRGWQVAGIEVARTDRYRWKDGWTLPAGENNLRTLIEAEEYESLSRRRVAQAIETQLAELRPAVVAVNGWAQPEAVAALRWCRRTGTGVVVMAESHVSSGNPFKEWLKRRRLRGVAAGLVGGGWHRDYLVRLGVPREGIFRGYDAVDNDHFRLGAQRALERDTTVRGELGLPGRYLFACSRLIARKNVNGLLRAFAGMKDRQIGLVVAGDGEEAPRLRGAAEELGIADRVRWVGAVSYQDLPKYYGLAAGFVHLAHEEAWGLVVNEAAAAGLPLLIASKVGAACELVRERQSGWTIESADVAGTTAALERLASLSGPERSAMGQAARELVADFGPERFGQGLLDSVLRVAHS